MILMRTNPLLRPLEGVGPENLNFFGIKWHSFRAQKSLSFQGPPLPMALEMNVACIKIIFSRPI
jgi:hypothetical protein